MLPWLQAFEVWAVNKLLSTPVFHRMVREVHRKVQNIRYGPPPEELGGTKIDVTSGPKHFLRLLKDAAKELLQDKPRR